MENYFNETLFKIQQIETRFNREVCKYIWREKWILVNVFLQRLYEEYKRINSGWSMIL